MTAARVSHFLRLINSKEHQVEILEQGKKKKPASAASLPHLEHVTNGDKPLPLLLYLQDSMSGAPTPRGSRPGFQILWEELTVLHLVEKLHTGLPLEQENAANGLRLLAVENRLPPGSEVLEVALVDVADKLRMTGAIMARAEAAYTRSLCLFVLNMIPEQLPAILAADYVAIFTKMAHKSGNQAIALEATRVLLKLALICLESSEGLQSAFLTQDGKPALVTILESQHLSTVVTHLHLSALVRLLRDPIGWVSKWCALMILRLTIKTDGDGKISLSKNEVVRAAGAGALEALMDGAVAAREEDRGCFLTAAGNICNFLEGRGASIPFEHITAFVDSVMECEEALREPAVYVFSGLAKREGWLKALGKQNVVQLLLDVAIEESFGKCFEEGGNELNICPPGLRASSTLCALARCRDPDAAAATATTVTCLLSKMFLANGYGGKPKVSAVNKRDALPLEMFISGLFSLKGDVAHVCG